MAEEKQGVVTAADVDRARFLMRAGYQIDWDHSGWYVGLRGKLIERCSYNTRGLTENGKIEAAGRNMIEAISCAEDNFRKKGGAGS